MDTGTLTKNINLDARLLEISRMTGSARHVLDIGCDHGRLSVALLQSITERTVTATDISRASVQKTLNLRDKCGMQSRLRVFRADGFMESYPPPAPDCAVIAGMGGMLIADIIERGMDICKTLDRIVMQPMRGTEKLRRFLYEANFSSLDERLVFDSGRIYQVFSYRYTGEREKFPEGFPEDYFEIGHRLFEKKDPLLHVFLSNRINELSSALTSIENNAGNRNISDISALQLRLEKTKAALLYMEQFN